MHNLALHKTNDIKTRMYRLIRTVIRYIKYVAINIFGIVFVIEYGNRASCMFFGLDSIYSNAFLKGYLLIKQDEVCNFRIIR